MEISDYLKLFAEIEQEFKKAKDIYLKNKQILNKLWINTTHTQPPKSPKIKDVPKKKIINEESLRQAYDKANGKIGKIAEILGVSRKTLSHNKTYNDIINKFKNEKIVLNAKSLKEDVIKAIESIDNSKDVLPGEATFDKNIICKWIKKNLPGSKVSPNAITNVLHILLKNDFIKKDGIYFKNYYSKNVL
jgi:uncharacterized protein YifN (PemK superfamily)